MTPDKLASFLNDAFRHDPSNSSLFTVFKPFNEVDQLKIPKLGGSDTKILKSHVLNWLEHASRMPFAEFVEWKKNAFQVKADGELYEVDLGDLQKRQNVASVRVDVYPSEAIRRFPIVLSRPGGLLSPSTSGTAVSMIYLSLSLLDP
jgi:hypothetical protein